MTKVTHTYEKREPVNDVVYVSYKNMKPGTIVAEGTFLRKETRQSKDTGKPYEVYFVEDDEDKEVCFSANGPLKSKLAAWEVGDRIRVTFVGKEPTEFKSQDTGKMVYTNMNTFVVEGKSNKKDKKDNA